MSQIQPWITTKCNIILTYSNKSYSFTILPCSFITVTLIEAFSHICVGCVDYIGVKDYFGFRIRNFRILSASNSYMIGFKSCFSHNILYMYIYIQLCVKIYRCGGTRVRIETYYKHNYWIEKDSASNMKRIRKRVNWKNLTNFVLLSTWLWVRAPRSLFRMNASFY